MEEEMTRLRYTSMAQCLAVSRSPADNCEGPLLYCLPGVNQPVISTANGFSTLRSTLWACMWAHLSRFTPRSSPRAIF